MQAKEGMMHDAGQARAQAGATLIENSRAAPAAASQTGGRPRMGPAAMKNNACKV